MAQLRKKIERDVPAILEAMTKAAKDGDTTAAKLLLERVVPALKPMDSPARLDLSGSLANAGEVVLRAVGEGIVTPDQAAKLLQGLGAQARVVESTELEERIRALESRQ